MTLTGGLRGSALIKETGERTRVELTLRSTAGLTLLTLSSGGSARTSLEGSAAELRQKGIYALGLSKEGRLIAYGMSAKAGESARILERLRLAAAEEPAEVKKEQAPAEVVKKEKDGRPQAHNVEANAPSASVTRGILEQARRLFGALNALNGAQEEENAERKEEKEEAESVANPFPRTFPGAVWVRKPGEASLTGTVRTASGPREANAIPVGSRGRFRQNSGRVLLGRDGVRYWVTVGS